MAKICVVGPSKKFFSGVSIYTIRLANTLSGSNTVSVLMLRNLLPKFMYPGKKHVGLQEHSVELVPDIRMYEGMDWNSPSSWLKAYRFLKKERPDVIVMQWWTSAVAHMELFIVLANRFKLKAGLILEMHEVVDPLEASKPGLRYYSRIMGKSIMNRADAFVAHSAAMKEQIARIYHLKDDKVFVIPHGVYDIYSQKYSHESARRELGISELFVILYFGLIRKYKGVPYLVEAFNRLPGDIASNSRLIIAGEDWGDEKGLATIIGSSPYNGQITFKPEFISDADVPRYFTAADVVVLPYLRTSGSGVTSLAVAYGKPIIITDLEHTRESLREYRGAMFVPCADAASMSSEIAGLYARHKAGEIAAYDVPPDKSWQHIASEYEKIIDTLIEARRAVPLRNQ